MPTTTPNFGWSVPVSTDLVKDGATAIELLGDSIDASLVDLKGGTTGQVLAKASGTDMDFSWVAQDDSNAIQNAIMDAKGDLIGATAADTPARLAVGANGTVLTADSAEATGLKWATVVSGGMTLIATATPSASTSVSFTSIPTTYKQLILVWTNVFQSTTDDYWSLRINNNSSGLYSARGLALDGSGVVVANNFQNATSFGNEANNAVIGKTSASATTYQSNANGYAIIQNADLAATHSVSWVSSGQGASVSLSYTGFFNSAVAVTQLDLIRSSTQTITGTFRLYGVA